MSDVIKFPGKDKNKDTKDDDLIEINPVASNCCDSEEVVISSDGDVYCGKCLYHMACLEELFAEFGPGTYFDRD